VLYYFGDGVDKDKAQALSWMRKAAEQGNSEAQVKLGLSYEIGDGLPKDAVEAYAWYNLAAASGVEDASTYRRSLEREMPPALIHLGQQRTKEIQREINGRLESAEEIRKAIEKERSKGA
jgi:TPR repeat protein